MVGDRVYPIVLSDHSQHPFSLAERESHQLLQQEGDEEYALVRARPSKPPSPLPEREFVGMATNRLQSQAETVDGEVVIPFEVDGHLLWLDRECVHARLPGKVEYVARHFDFCGYQSNHLPGYIVNGLSHTLIS